MKPKHARTTQLVDPLRTTAASASQISRSQIRSSETMSPEQDCVYGMNDCFRKLKGMVPNVPSNKRLSKVEILQYVIDYIQDLQCELQIQPIGAQGREEANQRGVERIPLSAISFNQLTDTV